MASSFSRLAVPEAINVRSILNDQSLNQEWMEIHGYIQSEVLGGHDVPHSANLGDLRVIYHFVRHLKPRRALEIGTGFGATTLYLGAALKKNAVTSSQAAGTLTTVDVHDVNDWSSRPLAGSGLSRSPREAVRLAGLSEIVVFKVARSYDFLAEAKGRFDFVFLDGSTAAADVYRDLQNINQAIEDDTVVLLHVYFPQGRPLWHGESAITGPWRAVQRFHGEGALLTVLPLGQLPWPTKRGGNITSLALVCRLEEGSWKQASEEIRPPAA